MKVIEEEEITNQPKKGYSTKQLFEKKSAEFQERAPYKSLKQLKKITIIDIENESKNENLFSDSSNDSIENEEEASDLQCFRRETKNPIAPNTFFQRRNSLKTNSIFEEDDKKENLTTQKRNNYFTQALAMINTNDFSYEQIEKERMIEAFKRNTKMRNLEDIKIIINSLLKTKLNDIITQTKKDNLRFTFLVYSMAKEIEYELVKKGQSVFKIGEKGEKFYIILSGNMHILKPVEEYSYFSYESYLQFISKLIEQNEIFIVKKTLAANKDILNIESESIEHALDSIFKRRLVGFIRGKQPTSDEIESFFHKLNRKLNQNELNFALLQKLEKDAEEIQRKLNKDKASNTHKLKSEIEKEKRNLNSITDKINLLISNYTTYLNNFLKNHSLYYETDLKLDNPEEIKPYIVYNYNYFHTLQQGNYFGDNAIDNNTLRNATIIAAEEDCHLAVLEKDFYNEHILTEKIKLYSLKIDFVFNSVFNKFLKKTVFEKKYFNFFIYEEYFKDFVLQRQSEKVNFVYFIFEGSLELHCKKNYFELEDDIRNLSKHCVEIKKEIFIDAETSNYLKNFDPHKPSNKVIKEDLKNKRSLILKKIGKNEIFGIENFVNNFPSLFSAVVNSNKLIAFKIEAQNLRNIIKAESSNDAEDFFKAFSSKKIVTLISRLYEIKKGMIEIAKVKNGKRASSINTKKNSNNNQQTSLLGKMNTLKSPVAKRNNSVFSNLNFNKNNNNFNLNSNVNNNSVPYEDLILNKNENSIIIEESFYRNNNRISGTITLNTPCVLSPFRKQSDVSKLINDVKDSNLNTQTIPKNKNSNHLFVRTNTINNNNLFNNVNENNSSTKSFYNLKSKKNQKFKALNNNIDTDIQGRNSLKYIETFYSIASKSEVKDTVNDVNTNNRLAITHNTLKYEENIQQALDVINDTEKLLKNISNPAKIRKSVHIENKVKYFNSPNRLANDNEESKENGNTRNSNEINNGSIKNANINKTNNSKNNSSSKKKAQSLSINLNKTNNKKNFDPKIYLNTNNKIDFHFTSSIKDALKLQFSEIKTRNNIVITEPKFNFSNLNETNIKEKIDLESTNENINDYLSIFPNTDRKNESKENKYLNLIPIINNFKIKNNTKLFNKESKKHKQNYDNSISVINDKTNTLPQIGKLNCIPENKNYNNNNNNESPVKRSIFTKNNNNRIFNFNNILNNTNDLEFENYSTEMKTAENLILFNHENCKTSRNSSSVENLKKISFFNDQKEEENINSFNLFNLYHQQFETSQNNNNVNSNKTFYPKNILSLNNLFCKSTKLKLEKRKIISHRIKKDLEENDKPSKKFTTVNFSTSEIFNLNIAEKFKDTIIYNDIIKSFSFANLNLAKSKKIKELIENANSGNYLFGNE